MDYVKPDINYCDSITCARLHDIGKIVIPESILESKKGLSNEEFDIIKTHSRLGYDIVKDLGFNNFIAEGVLHHHENIDGTGYPCNIIGKDIPYIAKVIRVIDMFDAITSVRPYRQPVKPETGLQVLINKSGFLLDENIVFSFIEAYSTYMIKEKVF